MELEAVGGTFGGILEPTTFICLMLKMLQAPPAARPSPSPPHHHPHAHPHPHSHPSPPRPLQIQPEKEIVVEFIKNEDYKYVRALGAYYLRLTGRPVSPEP